MSAFARALLGVVKFARNVAGVGAVAAVSFVPPTVTEREGAVLVSGELEGAITSRAAKVIEAGAPVKIQLQGKLQAKRGGRVRELTASSAHTISFDTLSTVVSVDKDGVVQVFDDPRAAAQALAKYTLRFDGAAGAEAMDLYVEASISYSSGTGLSGASEALWDYKRPFMKIQDMHKMLERSSNHGDLAKGVTVLRARDAAGPRIVLGTHRPERGPGHRGHATEPSEGQPARRP